MGADSTASLPAPYTNQNQTKISGKSVVSGEPWDFVLRVAGCSLVVYCIAVKRGARGGVVTPQENVISRLWIVRSIIIKTRLQQAGYT